MGLGPETILLGRRGHGAGFGMVEEKTKTVENSIFDGTDMSSGVIARAMGEIARSRIDYADIYFESRESESWRLAYGVASHNSRSSSRGVGVRAVSGEKVAFAASNALNGQGLIEASKAVRAIASAGQSRCAALGPWSSYRKLYGDSDPILSMGGDEKIALLEKIDRLARAKDPRVKEVSATLSSSFSQVLVARMDGRAHADARPLVRLDISVLLEGENGLRQRSGRGGGGRFSLDRFDDALIERFIDESIRSAALNLIARSAPAGEMEVVLGSGWPGILLHEAVGHGLEADFNRKKTSAFTDLIGTKVAADGVTVVDQGNLEGRRGSLTMDDEGNPTGRTVLIENGVLKGYMQDELNSRLMGMPVTGNGRRESHAFPPMPRMTNTFMENGTLDPEEIIASVKDGIYAERFSGGSVDITSGRFVFNCDLAWKVENGKKLYPVRGVTLIGNGPEVMRHIALIGNDLQLDEGIGVCGKNGQSVPVGVGQPTLKVAKGLVVGGSKM